MFIQTDLGGQRKQMNKIRTTLKKKHSFNVYNKIDMQIVTENYDINLTLQQTDKQRRNKGPLISKKIFSHKYINILVPLIFNTCHKWCILCRIFQ